MNGTTERLQGTGRVGDNLYLLAHDDVTGKALLQPRALGLGLAGALLAELMFAGSIWISGDRIEFTAPENQWPRDELGRHVLGVLLAEPEWHPVRDWLSFLAASSAGHVGWRLKQAGYLSQVPSRLPWRGTRLKPADPDAAFAPLIRVRLVMDRTRSSTVSDGVLAGLAVACGLDARVMPYAPADARKTLLTALRHLRPGLRELIAATQAAVDSALLSHRV